jgi:hypothetical protein
VLSATSLGKLELFRRTALSFSTTTSAIRWRHGMELEHTLVDARLFQHIPAIAAVLNLVPCPLAQLSILQKKVTRGFPSNGCSSSSKHNHTTHKRSTKIFCDLKHAPCQPFSAENIGVQLSLSLHYTSHLIGLSRCQPVLPGGSHPLYRERSTSSTHHFFHCKYGRYYEDERPCAALPQCAKKWQSLN